MPTYRFTMTCGHSREVEADQPPASRTPHCYECREATGKKVQKPMREMFVRDGKKWTPIDLPEPAPRGEGRKSSGGKKARKVAPVEVLNLAMAEARALKTAKANGEPLPDTPNLDAINAAHGIATVKGQKVEEPSTDEATSAETTEAEPVKKVTRKPAAKQTAKKTPAKAAAKKTPASKREVTPIPKKGAAKKTA